MVLRYLSSFFLILILAAVSYLSEFTSAQADATLPIGHEGARWGMNVDELKKISGDLVQADNRHKFYFGEHFETEPDVYYKEKGKEERIEYYFYKGKLYKVFIIYDRELYETSFYEDLVKKTKDSYGAPKDVFEEKTFGLRISHALWDDGETTLDIRKGAGFIFQVLAEKSVVSEKEKAQKKKKGI